MSIEWAEIAGGTLRVLIVGILFGAGLPALFSAGMYLWDRGSGGIHADGTTTSRRPALTVGAYAIFAIAALIVLYGLLFITKASIDHYLGIALPI